MGILSKLLAPAAAGHDKAISEGTNLPQAQQPQATSSSPTPNGFLSVDDQLREKMRTNPRARAVRQLSLFFAGTAFFGLSLLITRRTVARKLLADAPKRFTPSNFQPKDVNGGLEAAQAFGLATMNVTSAALMLTGGAMYALDVTDRNDMREKFKKSWGFERKLSDDEEKDEEMEDMVKQFLDKKEDGENKQNMAGLASLVAAMASKEEERLANKAKGVVEAVTKND
jgi:hypothetical protein